MESVEMYYAALSLFEEIKKIREGSKDGGLIDKPLPGRSRDI